MDLSPTNLAQILGGRLVAAEAPLATATVNRIAGVPATTDAPVEVASKLPPVVIDSRQAETGCIFWALSGTQCDGADFVSDAFERGAAGAVTARAGQVPPPGRWIIQVADPLVALHRLAAHLRQQTAATVIAVTGSVGKTTTKELIRTLLAAQHRTVASAGNHNNHLGLPLSMLGLQADTQFGLFELAASAAGEIGQLAALCQPHWGVITSVADAHLQGFGSYDGVAAAKTELAAALPADGLLILNGDDPRLRRWANAANVRRRRGATTQPPFAGRIIWVGRGADCHVRADHVRYREAQLEFRVGGVPFCVPLAGRHFLPNVLAAIAVALEACWNLSDISDVLVHFTGVPLRCEVSQVQGVTIISDAYNACPTSMQAALRALWETPQRGRRFVICGDMLELGAQAEQFHIELGEAIVYAAGADGLLTCGHWAETVASAAQAAGMRSERLWVAADYQRHLAELAAVLRPGDAVLVKASRALRLEGAAENLKKLLAQKPKRHFPATETLLFTLPAGGMKDFSAPANRM